LKDVDGNLSSLLAFYNSESQREERKSELLTTKNQQFLKQMEKLSPRSSTRLSKVQTEAQIVDQRR